MYFASIICKIVLPKKSEGDFLIIRLYFGRWGRMGRFRTVVKLPRLLRTLGDLGDKGASVWPPPVGTCAAIDTGDELGGKAINFCSNDVGLSSTVDESSWSKQSV